ncbi:hypothetical protein UPYG_G00129220 [Umbra pygmaea]|uniref:Protein yippee-like n=1 Tax=Umbra pygmaea TaxID=75934 RepID=A0ABD0X6P0_UMBPY
MSMKRDPKGSNTTFDFSVDYGAYAHSTADKYTSNDTTVEDEDSNEQVVFLCGSCRLPVGDSQSWAGSDEEQNQIILKRVSDNVLVGKETHIAGTTKDLGW